MTRTTSSKFGTVVTDASARRTGYGKVSVTRSSKSVRSSDISPTARMVKTARTHGMVKVRVVPQGPRRSSDPDTNV